MLHRPYFKPSWQSCNPSIMVQNPHIRTLSNSHINLVIFAKKFCLRYLKAVNKYFWKYRWRLFLGMIFILLSNYFRILTPQVTGYVVNTVEKELRDSVRRKHVVQDDAASNKADKKILAEGKKDTANY